MRLHIFCEHQNLYHLYRRKLSPYTIWSITSINKRGKYRFWFYLQLKFRTTNSRLKPSLMLKKYRPYNLVLFCCPKNCKLTCHQATKSLGLSTLLNRLKLMKTHRGGEGGFEKRWCNSKIHNEGKGKARRRAYISL